MRVLICRSPESITSEDIPTPKTQSDKILVRIKYCGICAYDLKRYLGRKNITYPVVLGHEPSGIVEEVGSGIQNLNEGDKVAVDVKVKCGRCENCRKGIESRCLNAEASNGFAQFILVPEENVFRVPSKSDLSVVTLAEPLACIIHGFKKIDLREGSSLLVVGDGIMGILAGFIGKFVKNINVVLAGHNKQRLNIAKTAGFDIACTKNNTIASLFDKFDSIVLTVSDKEVLNDISRYLFPGGIMLFLGELKDSIYNLNMNLIYTNEYALIGSKGYARQDFMDAVGIIDKYSGILEMFISKIYKFDELEAGFNDLRGRQILKGVLEIS